MNKNNSELLKSLGNLGALGFTLVLSTFAGLFLGIWLDKITGLKPLFTIGLLLFGIIAGFIKIFKETIKSNNNDKL